MMGVRVSDLWPLFLFYCRLTGYVGVLVQDPGVNVRR